MRIRKRTIALGIVAMFAAFWGIWWAAYAGPDISEPPADWSLAEMAEEMYPGGNGRAYALAWKIEEGDPRLRVERCLALRVFENNPECWLAHLERHPLGDDPKWRRSQTFIPGTAPSGGLFVLHTKTFPQRPNNDEIYAAMDWVAWCFEEGESIRLVRCGVCRESWQEAIGAAPTQFFTYRPRGLLDGLGVRNWLGRRR